MNSHEQKRTMVESALQTYMDAHRAEFALFYDRLVAQQIDRVLLVMERGQSVSEHFPHISPEQRDRLYLIQKQLMNRDVYAMAFGPLKEALRTPRAD